MTQQPPIHVCVANLLESRHQKKTGIPRVEYEIAKFLSARGATVIAWGGRRFHRVDFARVVDSITRAQSLDLETICAQPQLARPPAAHQRMLARVCATLARPLPVNSEPGRTLARTAFRRVAAVWPHLSPAQRHAMAQRLRLADDADRLGRFIDVLASGGEPSADAAHGPVEFARGGIVLLLGIWWNQRPLDAIARLKRERGLRLVAMVHDLIPIRRPEFFTDETGRQRFTRFIDGLLASADTLCATSAHVAHDIEAYARERQVAIRPVARVPLCSDLERSVVPQLTAALARHALEPGRFVVYVSTINPRKNHLFAYRLWRRLVDELGEAAPTLVFAGQRGWRYEALFETMTADTPMWNRKLRFVEGPTDAEVAWLYANCAFSIFPSLYEGWGLPILESLSFGKYCLAADNTSLPEAGQGLAFHAGAEDEGAWLAELRRVLTEPGYLDAANARIRERFVARDWDTVGAELLAVIESLDRP